MSDTPYLLAVIAHGKPVFEIGYKMECPECYKGIKLTTAEVELECEACEGLGHWWITNSGWRARPYWSEELAHITTWDDEYGVAHDVFEGLPSPPPDHPDLFQSYIDRTPRSVVPSDVLSKLGLLKPKAPLTKRSLG